MVQTIWLIGMMGSGKSTVAPLVAKLLDREWVDADAAVEHISGRRIADLFAESESAFRKVEAEVIQELAGSSTVVACGGGVVTDPTLAEVMRRTGIVIWLDTSLATLEERVGDGASRPLLTGGTHEGLRRLQAERAGLYRAAADAVVATDGCTIDEVAAGVVRAWNASSEA